MTEYEITIDGYESGLTDSTIRKQFENIYPDVESVTVEEKE